MSMKKTWIVIAAAVAAVAVLGVLFQRSRACEAELRSKLAAERARAEAAESAHADIVKIRGELEERLGARGIELENAVARADTLQRQSQHARREIRRLSEELDESRELVASLQAEVRKLQQELLASEATEPALTDYERQRYESEILQLRSRAADAPDENRSYSSGQTFSAPLTVKILSISPAQDVLAFTRDTVENIRINDRYLLARGNEFVAAVQVTQLQPQFAVAVVVSPNSSAATLNSGETLTILRL